MRFAIIDRMDKFVLADHDYVFRFYKSLSLSVRTFEPFSIRSFIFYYSFIPAKCHGIFKFKHWRIDLIFLFLDFLVLFTWAFRTFYPIIMNGKRKINKFFFRNGEWNFCAIRISNFATEKCSSPATLRETSGIQDFSELSSCQEISLPVGPPPPATPRGGHCPWIVGIKRRRGDTDGGCKNRRQFPPAGFRQGNCSDGEGRSGFGGRGAGRFASGVRIKQFCDCEDGTGNIDRRKLISKFRSGAHQWNDRAIT